MRRTPLVFALALLASCDAPAFTSVSEAQNTFAFPAGPGWTKDTVSLGRYLQEGVAGDFTPDTIFPFHIYWHRNGVHPRIRAAVRRAAARWSAIVNRTEVLPYVFQSSASCWLGGNEATLSYDRGDMLAGGFHLYVSSDPEIDSRNGIWASGPCVPYYGDYHPVTNAPPNGFTFIGGSMADPWWSDDVREEVAVHEIGHLLGHGIGLRWYEGLERDSVIVDGLPRHFYVQTDSVAIRRYEEWLRNQGKEPYRLRKLPLQGPSHWHGCVLASRWLSRDKADVMAYNLPVARSGYREEVTQVTASMLQGFKVDWDQFIDNTPGVYQWTPDEYHWTECPQVRFTLDSLGLAMDQAPDSADDVWPDFPDLGNDIRPWTYIRQGR